MTMMRIVILCLAASFASANDCEDLARYENLTSGPDIWDSRQFSNPVQLSEDYIYVVHANNTITNKYDVFLEKELGEVKPVVFASIISSRKPITFGSSGFILGFKPNHVVGCTEDDSRFSFGNLEENQKSRDKIDERLDEYAAMYPIMSPRELLNATRKNSYWNNEVLFRGKSPDGEPVTIEAVFVWGDRNGVYPNNIGNVKRTAEAVEFAKKRGLPIVVLRGPAARYEDKPATIVRNSAGEITQIYRHRRWEKEVIDFSGDRFYTIIRQDRHLINEMRWILFSDNSFIAEIRAMVETNPNLRLELEILQATKAAIPGSEAAKFFALVL